jgi:hypothetical protein
MLRIPHACAKPIGAYSVVTVHGLNGDPFRTRITGGIGEDVAEGLWSSAVESEELSNPDLWLQCDGNGSVRQDLVRPHFTACAYARCLTGGRPRGKPSGQNGASYGH